MCGAILCQNILPSWIPDYNDPCSLLNGGLTKKNHTSLLW